MSPGSCDAEGIIRLVGGNNNNTGRVEVCSGGLWGTVCDDSWGAAEAQVVCRQLSFSPEGIYHQPCSIIMFTIIIGAIARGNAFFGQGVGSIVIDDAQCTGSESALIACKNTTMHNCGHSEDAGVECPG